MNPKWNVTKTPPLSGYGKGDSGGYVEAKVVAWD